MDLKVSAFFDPAPIGVKHSWCMPNLHKNRSGSGFHFVTVACSWRQEGAAESEKFFFYHFLNPKFI